MKKIISLIVLLLPVLLFAQTYTGSQANNKIEGAVEVRMADDHRGVDYIKFSEGNEIPLDDFELWATKALQLGEDHSFTELGRQQDKLGYEHIRLQLNYQKVPLISGMVVLHVRDNMIESLNGQFPANINPANDFSLPEQTALQHALNFVDAETYKWEIPEEEEFIRSFTNDPEATFYPKAEQAIVPLQIQGEPAWAYAWKFDIYAHEPVYRADIYVDASNGEVLLENKTIHHIDSLGTAETKYSGTRPITTQYHNNEFRLRETGRGNGIETYNMNNSTNYNNAVDFTNPDNSWDLFNASLDEVATDAHWGSEVTWDYFYNQHNRNSVDGNGHTLISFVHYDVDYVNAFWNGQFMTYGDGNSGQGITPLTALDIVAHEITHGMTSYTADLIYQDESGALNEGFSDIFGSTVEAYARPNNHNWQIGEDIGYTLRGMDDPNAYQLPDTYHGSHWYTGTGDNGGVHTNMSPLNYWYYLIVEGGNGVNDNNDSYQVSGMGMDSAASIAYRMLTVYLTPASEYDEARFYAIKSATDLYGACSPAVETVTDAMYAIGVGDQYVQGVQADYTADVTSFCQPPATVNFQNLSNNGVNYIWDFGDGNTDNSVDPSHTYTQYGDFTVKLIADGGSCGIDSVVDSAKVSISSGNPCHNILPKNGKHTITDCNGVLYDDGGPNTNYSNDSEGAITIAPPGATSIDLTFTEFDFESGYDYLKIYEGTSTSGNLVGSYDGSNLPNGGSITVSANAVTIQQLTDQYVTEEGFVMQWNCNFPNVAPGVDFKVNDTISCDGLVYFQDLSSHGPANWEWDFGDGNTSNIKNPVHQYNKDGVYDVSLKVSNSFGSDSLQRNAFVEVSTPGSLNGDTFHFCYNDTVSAQLSANGTVYWYESLEMDNLLHTGNSFSPSGVNTDTTFYATNVVDRPSVYGGKSDNSGGGGMFTAAYEHYLVFDAYQPVLLKSVKVYAQSSGNREIVLRDDNGNVIESKVVDIPVGEQRIDLNFLIPAGSDFKLAGPVSPGLYRNDNGLNYPYTSEGLVSIKYSSAGSDPLGYYYYFYDWEVIPQACQNQLQPFSFRFYQNEPVAGFDWQIDKSKVEFDNQSSKSAAFLWDFGDGTQSSMEEPVHYYTQTGTYDVKLIADNPCGTDSITNSLTITEVGVEDRLADQIQVYPNPVDEKLIIEFGNLITARKFRLYTMSGKQLQSVRYPEGNHSDRAQINVEALDPGVYILQIYTDNAVIQKKIIVI
ncbi:MAG: M4 family metallopeptidase [Bacteroidales bacterium]